MRKPERRKPGRGAQLDIRGFTVPGATSSGAVASCSSTWTSAQRQASLTDMGGVVAYQDPATSDALLEGIPSTLYLGEDDVNTLKARLLDAKERGSAEDMLTVLRRLSAMPCTRSLLETTRIGEAVGKLRKAEDERVAELAARIVRVWKGQIAEHREQDKARRAQQGGGARGSGHGSTSSSHLRQPSF